MVVTNHFPKGRLDNEGGALRPCVERVPGGSRTIGSQIEVLRARIATEGHELVAEFCDNKFSGARLDRPALTPCATSRSRMLRGGVVLVARPLARAYVYQSSSLTSFPTSA